MLLLAWTGFASRETHLFAAYGPETVVAAAPAGAESGDVADHHLDDLPSQAHAETQADLPEWQAGPERQPALASSGLTLAAQTPRAWQSASMGGLLRPPRPSLS